MTLVPVLAASRQMAARTDRNRSAARGTDAARAAQRAAAPDRHVARARGRAQVVGNVVGVYFAAVDRGAAVVRVASRIAERQAAGVGRCQVQGDVVGRTGDPLTPINPA